MLHPFQPFAMGQLYFPIRLAKEKNIKLIIYGDSYAEKGLGGNLYTKSSAFNPGLYTYKDEKDLFFGGKSIEELKKYNIKKNDLIPYMPLKENELENKDFEVLQLPYYLNYNPQSNYYYSVQNTDFEVNPDGRTRVHILNMLVSMIKLTDYIIILGLLKLEEEGLPKMQQ